MTKQQVIEVEIAPPSPRLRLKGRVYAAGYRIGELATEMEVHHTMVSKILGGHEHPSPRLQRLLAEKLGLTLKELQSLL